MRKNLIQTLSQEDLNRYNTNKCFYSKISTGGINIRVLIGIPLYNEQRYLSKCISSLFHFIQENCQSYEISVLLVDDGSTDQSQAIYEKLSEKYPFSHIRHRKGPLGYGRAILTLFRRAQKKFDYLITFDADLQHDPMSIKEILECFKNSNNDVVSTSRYLSYRFWDQNTKVPIDRYLTNMFITRTVNQCYNLILSDSFCGLKGYQASQLPTNLEDAGYAFPLVYWHFASQNGLKIKEIETPIIYRSDRRARGEWKQRTKEYFVKLESLVLSSELKQLVQQNYESGKQIISKIIDNQPNFPVKIYADFFNGY